MSVSRHSEQIWTLKRACVAIHSISPVLQNKIQILAKAGEAVYFGAWLKDVQTSSDDL